MEREKWLEISLPLETNFFPFLFLPRNHPALDSGAGHGKGQHVCVAGPRRCCGNENNKGTTHDRRAISANVSSNIRATIVPGSPSTFFSFFLFRLSSRIRFLLGSFPSKGTPLPVCKSYLPSRLLEAETCKRRTDVLLNKLTRKFRYCCLAR